jgi:hypothetical protein
MMRNVQHYFAARIRRSTKAHEITQTQECVRAVSCNFVDRSYFFSAVA